MTSKLDLMLNWKSQKLACEVKGQSPSPTTEHFSTMYVYMLVSNSHFEKIPFSTLFRRSLRDGAPIPVGTWHVQMH